MMERAMRLRGFRGRSFRGLTALASLAGSLLVRSYERSDLVYKAMVLRGYGQPTRPLDDFQVRPADIAGLLAILLVAAGFVIAEML
jgi:cobalt/nickel transport system permease protein